MHYTCHVAYRDWHTASAEREQKLFSAASRRGIAQRLQPSRVLVSREDNNESRQFTIMRVSISGR